MKRKRERNFACEGGKSHPASQRVCWFSEFFIFIFYFISLEQRDKEAYEATKYV